MTMLWLDSALTGAGPSPPCSCSTALLALPLARRGARSELLALLPLCPVMDMLYMCMYAASTWSHLGNQYGLC